MSKLKEDLRDKVFAKAMLAAESDDPLKRAIGRLLASDITDAVGAFLDNESNARSHPLDVMGAFACYSASIYSAYLIKVPEPLRSATLSTIVSTIDSFTHDMIKEVEARNGK